MSGSKRSHSQQKSSKGQSSLHFGVITEVYANGTARAQIEDMDGMITMPLAVLHHNTSARIWYWMPEAGQRVALMLDEKGEQGVILGGIYTGANPPPVQNLDQFYFKFGAIEITGDITTGVVQIDCTRLEITNPTESEINGKAIAVIGAMDNDTESNGADALVTSGQL